MVSIVIPCYNAGSWVGECIQSALDQTWSDTEIIVIDDGSTDQSREVIASFGDRIRHEFTPNRGGAAARNRGLALSEGEWVQFIDADDLLVPDCIEGKVKMTRDPGVVACCGIEFMDFTARDGELGGPLCWLLDEYDIDTLLASGGPQTAAPLHRRADLESVGGFRVELPCAQDLDLHLRLAATQDLQFRSNGRIGVRIRPHYASVSRTAGRRMHYWIAESLLHCTGLLAERGRLTAEQRVAVAQRVARLARRVSLMGGLEEASELAQGARRLSSRWHEHAYRHPLAAAVARCCGFGFYERIYHCFLRMRRQGMAE
jgi:hypothetical protein